MLSQVTFVTARSHAPARAFGISRLTGDERHRLVIQKVSGMIDVAGGQLADPLPIEPLQPFSQRLRRFPKRFCRCAVCQR